MGLRSRQKGAEAERAAARILQAIYPDAQRRVSGEEGQGEKLGRDIKGTPGLCVQVKEMGTPRPLVAYEEAVRAAEAGEIPVAFVRQSTRSASTPFRVVLSMSDFLRLLNAYRGGAPGVTVIALDELRASGDEKMKARIG
jgi:hypothetical protein